MTTLPKRRVRIACCQFSAALGAYERNVSRAETLMQNLHPEDVDMLLLPEMAFTGYSFTEASQVHALAEDKNSGRTVQWAKQQAVRLNAYVIVGYPRVEVSADGDSTYYNSMCVINTAGVLIETYDKTHLYETDEKWATEGVGFQYIDTVEFGRVGLAICMDINPYRFTAPFEDYELANYMRTKQVNLIVLIANWLDSEPESDDSRGVPNYWVHRLKPVLYTDTVFIVCNRSGREETNAIYTGCSACISLKEPMLLGQLNKRQENILLVELSVPDRMPSSNAKGTARTLVATAAT
ncbi:hypothetical protein SARC_00487 [Sphaeroforma arctica JP610]|uniref:CN hydrolase domain-containing protein n=1 Tax=Sphaeroforma arctica JP610 TaxID=667725 RepID=A0A0L0GEF4_9EUKA|nr:hypothetical protein SARC_00487 [Sphaeroforma arctica JP610]KNC87395.1 hypothetical protein SARC_00487 [Sphaeroforma arctica JP610]|eukprot:XP_014161297.1 hypothetical protein SARC_00487 [Sphaeroforma arctica JP610]